MDWIKQIIECKKENWVSPGSLGQKIKKIRMLRKYTQKELGVMCGFSFSSADVRIAQYEKNKKIPREKILKDMCNALGETISNQTGRFICRGKTGRYVTCG